MKRPYRRMKHERIEEKDSFGEAKERTEDIETKKDRLEYGRNIDGKCTMKRERERAKG